MKMLQPLLLFLLFFQDTSACALGFNPSNTSTSGKVEFQFGREIHISVPSLGEEVTLNRQKLFSSVKKRFRAWLEANGESPQDYAGKAVVTWSLVLHRGKASQGIMVLEFQNGVRFSVLFPVGLENWKDLPAVGAEDAIYAQPGDIRREVGYEPGIIRLEISKHRDKRQEILDILKEEFDLEETGRQSRHRIHVKVANFKEEETIDRLKSHPDLKSWISKYHLRRKFYGYVAEVVELTSFSLTMGR